MSRQLGVPGTVPTRLRRSVRGLRDLPIWTKLGLIMIVPTLATIVVGTAGLLDKVQEANNADRSRTLAVLSGDAGNLVHALQDERAKAVQLLATAGGDTVAQQRERFLQSQQETDAAHQRYRFSRSTVADLPDNLRALLDRIETQLGELPVTRSQVDSLDKIPLSITEGRYHVLIADLLEIRDLSAQLAGDTALTDRLRAAAAVATAKEFLSQERVVVLQALYTPNRDWSQAVRRNYTAARNGRELAEVSFTAVATPEQHEMLVRTMVGPEVRETLLYEGTLDGLGATTIPADAVPADRWDRAMVGRADLMNTVEVALNRQAQQAATDLGDRVQREVLVETGLLLLTLLLGIFFAWLVARSMARSLRDLRHGALAVAQYGLPQAVARLRDPSLATQMSPASIARQIAEPLPVRSRDEFGQVTEAFNAVHQEAVRTAVEQAALRSSVATMFVNLARRSQILVDRLIGHLDRLERGEQDPDRLSELFQLDHLATRMRRNDENLLVLAGADSTRVQREPAALMDVLRAAQSEVEHYTRIEFGIVDQDIEIASHAVNDLVHLVAELFDNATAFSPPDTGISVVARRVGDRAVLQVEDRGIGMSPDQYAEANERLTTTPMVDAAVSRMMGLVVVARLAGRHGVKVELRAAQERGTIAEVVLPANVLVPRALAGRTQVPAGFPVSRPPAAVPPGRPIFPPPLALESGPTSAGGWSARDGWSGAQRPTGVPGSSVPTGAGAGLGAALASGLVGSGAGHGPNGTSGGGRQGLPAWYDLTGASGVPDAPASAPVNPVGTDPLPQRRPTGPQWGEPDQGDSVRSVPRQTTASPDLRRQAPPGRWEAAAGTLPPTATEAPATTYPPAWPPVAPSAGAHPDEPVPAVPDGLAASLDMTSELPRLRMEFPAATGEAGTGEVTSPSRYTDDMTMELPIFRELESAWFRAGAPASYEASGASPTAGSAPVVGTATGAVDPGDGWTGEAGGLTMTGSAATPPDAAVSWRSAADEGWLAAEAASDPQDGGITETGLPRRVPMAQLVPGGVDGTTGGSERRSPESVRGLLSAYHRGVQRGRTGQGKEPEPTSTGSQTSGKEQEA